MFQLIYRKTQFASIIVTALFAGMAICLFVFFKQVPFLDFRVSVVIASVLLMMVVALLLFYSLTIEIDEDRLSCYFGLGIVRKSFEIEKIERLEPARNSWIFGWGIRYVPTVGWMYNASGFKAVDVILKTGKKFRIGCEDPDEVIDAYTQAKELQSNESIV